MEPAAPSSGRPASPSVGDAFIVLAWDRTAPRLGVINLGRCRNLDSDSSLPAWPSYERWASPQSMGFRFLGDYRGGQGAVVPSPSSVRRLTFDAPFYREAVTREWSSRMVALLMVSDAANHE